MAAPATHQIEKAPLDRQHLGIHAAERTNRPIIDVDDPPGRDVELVVRRLVLSRVGRGRE
jgi:hypothetical protein